MRERIESAIKNSIHYLESDEQGNAGNYSTDYASYVFSDNRSFIEALKLELGGTVEDASKDGLGFYLNFWK